MIRIALHGATGKMGKVIDELIEAAPSFEVSARIHSGSGDEDWNRLLAADLIVDFSSATGLDVLVSRLSGHLYTTSGDRLPVLLSGTTGIPTELRRRLEALAGQMTALWAPNFSMGIFLLQKALRSLRGSPALRGFQTFIRDVHHAQKKDAPSGTALLLKEALGGEVPIESVREGETIGLHEVQLNSASETLRFMHDVQDRRVFAEGVLVAASELFARRGKFPKILLTLDHLFS